MEKKYFVVTVEEIFRRRVIVKLDTDSDAWDVESDAEELCNDGTINLGADDLQERNVKFLHEASHEERARLNIYEA